LGSVPDTTAACGPFATFLERCYNPRTNRTETHPLRKGSHMIKWAIIFFIVSLVAGFFGFTGVAEGSRTIAKVLFFIALAIFLIVLVFGVLLGILVF
jgi:uncharacterized membrane protein YtjA (UPF0391 family)